MKKEEEENTESQQEVPKPEQNPRQSEPANEWEELEGQQAEQAKVEAERSGQSGRKRSHDDGRR